MLSKRAESQITRLTTPHGIIFLKKKKNEGLALIADFGEHVQHINALSCKS